MTEKHDRSARVRRLPAIYVRAVDDEAIVLNIDTEQYVGFDAVARSMWEVLVTSESIAIAIDHLLEQFDAEREQIEADVDAFIVTLKENDLVVVEPAT